MQLELKMVYKLNIQPFTKCKMLHSRIKLKLAMKVTADAFLGNAGVFIRCSNGFYRYFHQQELTKLQIFVCRNDITRCKVTFLERNTKKETFTTLFLPSKVIFLNCIHKIIRTDQLGGTTNDLDRRVSSLDFSITKQEWQ